MSPRLGTGVSRKELLRTNTKSVAVARFLKFRALKDARPWETLTGVTCRVYVTSKSSLDQTSPYLGRFSETHIPTISVGDCHA